MLQEVLSIAKEISDMNLQINALMNIAVVHTYLKEIGEADTKLQQALKMAIESNHKLRTAQIYGNLGNIIS